MPYEVKRVDACPAGKPWGVVTQGTGSLHGCHPSKDDAVQQLKALYVNAPPDEGKSAPENYETRAEWDSAYITALPDSAFACIDASGRHYPHHSKGGALDLPHLRNALSRIGDKSNTQCGAAHLRAHAKAADVGESAMPDNYETRRFADFELREAQTVQSDPDSGVPPQAPLYGTFAMPTIYGHAAKFGVLSDDLGGFRERISREAFRKTLQEGDCRALLNHDTRLVLGRTSNGTLRLREDAHGLATEITLPDTSYARDLVASMRRGDINGMSFGFRVIRDDWSQEGMETVRTLKEVSLLDVSPVTYPAYPQTDCALRSLRAFQTRTAAPVQEDHPAAALVRAKAGALAGLVVAQRRLQQQRAEHY